MRNRTATIFSLLAVVCFASACGDGDNSASDPSMDIASEEIAAGDAADLSVPESSDGSPLENCTPGDYKEAKNGRCYLCNEVGYGFIGQGEELDDNDPCTDDLCDPVKGVLHPTNSGPCDDGDPMTVDDLCVEGECLGVPLICEPGKFATLDDKCALCNNDGTEIADAGEQIDDGDACTDDFCDPETGVGHEFNKAPCDDGDPETLGDQCAEGVCAGVGTFCTPDEYKYVQGMCNLCNDNGTDWEEAGEVINDGTPCTNDACDSKQGVLHLNKEGSCDDGDPETGNDTCVDGECIGTPIVCEAGEHVADNGLCHLCADDGSGYSGEGEPIDDGDLCTDDLCDPDQGVLHSFNDAPCDDGDPATGNDTCTDGECKGVPILCDPGFWTEDNGLCYLCDAQGAGYDGDGQPIDDGNPCTDDVCDPDSGVGHTDNDGPCDDGDPGTIYDTCLAGLCAGVPVVCPADEYVEDVGLCLLCNDDGTGFAGDGQQIDDDDVCTDDLCDAAAGVTHTTNNAPCDDGDPATGNDTCADGACAGVPIVCDAGAYIDDNGVCQLCADDGSGYVGGGQQIGDGNECTDDACDPAAGVTHTNNNAPCDDGDPDTINDTCDAGVCAGELLQICPAGDYVDDGGACRLCNGDGTAYVGPGEVIDDGDICTDDACDPGNGVENEFNTAPCDDGDPDTYNDACEDGVCAGSSIVCPPGDYVADAGLCYLCNGNGDGWVGDGEVIDDGNVCTNDLCDSGNGVEHHNNSAPCDDGDPNTALDTCNGGICAGVPVICPPGEWVTMADGWWCELCNDFGTDWAGGVDVDDENQCTEDLCDPLLGVTHTPLDGVDCWDFNPCTFDDVCVGDVCGGTPVDCDDLSVCTDDSCDPDLAMCVHTPVSVPCDDGVPETLDDTCVDGICVGMLDPDGDGVPNYGDGPVCDPPAIPNNCVDNCPYVANANQADANHDGIGNACQEPRWWMRVKTTDKVVALTFDDGWSNDAFEGLLDTLNTTNAYASFFINGMYIDDGTIALETLFKAQNGGHKLGNHTYNHQHGTNVAEAIQEITLCEQAYAALGLNTLQPIYRIPDPSALNPPWWVHLALQQTGYTESMLANFDSMDWVDDGPEISAQGLIDCVSDQVEAGDIISMHVGPESTVEALPQIIANLEAQGYVMLTLEQIVSYGTPEYFLDLSQVKTCAAYF